MVTVIDILLEIITTKIFYLGIPMLLCLKVVIGNIYYLFYQQATDLWSYVTYFLSMHAKVRIRYKDLLEYFQQF
jgi:hypothetical protein